MRRMLTISQAATQLGIEVDTLRRLEKEGAIKAERSQGGHRRFDAAEIARFARSRAGRRAGRGAAARIREVLRRERWSIPQPGS